MDGKRPSVDKTDAGNSETKRAKTEFPLEIVLDGVEYINLSCLLKTIPFAAYHKKHYDKSEKRFIENVQPEVFNVTKENVANGVFQPKQTYSPARDLRLVRKDGKINDFIECVRGALHQTAPPRIENLRFTYNPETTTTDETVFEVEMRGERTEKGIYLKVKDIGAVFEVKTLTDDIQHKHTQHEEGKDYVWFTIPENEREKKGSRRELFFTYAGMLLTVHISQSEVAKHFRKWISETVFVHHLGTQEQKKELAKSLLDKETINELTKRCVNDIGGLYLLETMIPPPNHNTGVKKKVYKYGYTKNVQRRMGEHVTTYGRESVVHAFVLLPIQYVCKAETKLKRILKDNYIHKEGKDTELLLLSEQDLTTVRESMRLVGETFYGETYVHTHQLEMLTKDHAHAVEMLKKDAALTLERAKKDAEVAKKDAEVAKKDTEVAKKDVIILEMTIANKDRRIRELEERLGRSKLKNANAA